MTVLGAWCILGHDSVDPNIATCELMHPDVQDALREDLRQNNCLQEVEIVPADEVLRAKRLFHRDGFVVVSGILDEKQIGSVKERCTIMAEEILKRDPKRLGNRGPYRYSMGPPHSTGHILHYPEIAQLVDMPTITPILKAIFGNDKYIVRGARGDFNLPGAPYQALHSDIWGDFLPDPAESEFPDSGRLDYRDLPILYVVVNYVLADLNALNAPIRQIPMTQQSHRVMPLLDDEPMWMKRSTLCPVPAGSVIIRDPRAWHGGTPNLSDNIRLMPNIEYYAYWFRMHHGGQMTRSLPREVYNNLTTFGKKICREVVAQPGEEIDAHLKEDVVSLYSEVMPCYYHMGLTDELIEELRQKGAVYDYEKTQGTVRQEFYGRKNSTSSQLHKDEL